MEEQTFCKRALKLAHPWDSESQLHLAELDGDNFQIKRDDLELGARYYYRAFAINQVGETKGTRKRLKIPARPSPVPGGETCRMPKMAGPSPPGLGPFKNLKEPNGSFILNWVGSTPPRKVRMESGSGWSKKAGSGPTGPYGPISGSMIPDPGSTSKEIGKVAN